MNLNDEFDGFSIELFKDDDGDWFAHFEELPNVSAFGDSPNEALRELSEAWKAIKESYTDHNEEIPVASIKCKERGFIKMISTIAAIDIRYEEIKTLFTAIYDEFLNSEEAQKFITAVEKWRATETWEIIRLQFVSY